MTAEPETDVSARPVAQEAKQDAPQTAPPPEDKPEVEPHGFLRAMRRWREDTIKATPAFIVNHASNLFGIAYLAAEGLMLKSAGMVFLKNHRVPGGTVHPIIDPANNVWLALRGKHPDGVLMNMWQARTTAAGIATWLIGAGEPERKDDQEKIDEAVQLKNQSPVKFYLNQFKHGFYLFNPKYKREQIGLGVTVVGILSTLSSWTNVDLVKRAHFSNRAQIVGGLITAVSGARLWFAQTDEQGWRRFAQTMWLRMATIPFVLHQKITHHDRWGWYLGGQIGLQGASMMAFLLGGAEKRADGTVIDHAKMRHEANKKYRQTVAELPGVTPPAAVEIKPATVVSQASIADTTLAEKDKAPANAVS